MMMMMDDACTMLQVVATGGDDRKVNLWRVTNAGNYWSLSGHTSPVQCLCFDPQETYVVSGSQGGSLKVYDLEVVRTIYQRIVVSPLVPASLSFAHPYFFCIIRAKSQET